MPGSFEITSGSAAPESDRSRTEEPLTVEERAALLAIARAAIHAAVAGDTPPAEAMDVPERLRMPGGVFVSLHHGASLRGCVGTVTPERSLVAATAEVAAAAATRDPRFLPVPPAEIDELEIEISVLSVAIPAAAAEVDPVRHGVCLRLGRRRAVFLPQVAAREGWDRETLLDHLSEKAGLAAHAWRDPEAAFLVFTVERVSGPLRYAASP